LEASSKELLDLIVELQSLDSLNSFVLAGGTSLAIRYNHRVSVDIDLFTNEIVGKAGFEQILEELKSHFKDSLKFNELIDPGSGDQYCFLRLLIKKDNIEIKVELLQNIQFIDPIEEYEGINTLSIKDIGLLKLITASNRKAKKDIYDLDFITEDISLKDLLEELELKLASFNEEKYKCLFDLDDEVNPVDNLSLLLEFDDLDYSSLPSRPSHSNDMINIVPGNKDWRTARSSWRRKVKNIMQEKGIPIPPVKPIN